MTTATSGEPDYEWMKKKLNEFQLGARPQSSGGYASPYTHSWAMTNDELLGRAQVVEPILDTVTPDWRTTINVSTRDRWAQHRTACVRAISQIHNQAELAQKLGDTAPRLSASELHPWIWDGARSLWNSGHIAQAVQAATVKLNAETQNKLGRKDISEVSLFQQAFSSNPPKPGEPRLHIEPNDGTRSWSDRQKGAIAIADGLYGAIRNPLSHAKIDLPRDEALEQLAAFSILARWVDRAIVIT